MNPSRYLYPWLKPTFQALISDKLPQSLLIHGQAGIGKLGFGLTLANQILCEGSSSKPCGECNACRWFAGGNHPDFIGVLPEELQNQLPHSAQASEGVVEKKSASEDKKLSKFIKIEQIRGCISGLELGTHRGGRKVLLIYPVEAMQTAAANSLLKALEEPPPNTVMILITHHLDQILPTIRSRCRLLGIGRPTDSESLLWLKSNPKISSQPIEKIETLLRECSGSPLMVLEQIENKSPIDTSFILEALIKGKSLDWLTLSESTSKLPILDVINLVQRWAFDLQLYKQTQKINYYPQYQTNLKKLSETASTEKILSFNKLVSEAKRRALHPLIPKLQLEALLMQYSQIF